MVGDENGGPSKKPRIDEFIDLAEIDDLKEQVRKLEEKNKQLRSLEEQNEQLKTSLKEVQVEKKEVDEVLVSRLYRDLRLTSIGGGADEVMLGIIGKTMGILPNPQKNKK